jgi:hypothetical protein
LKPEEEKTFTIEQELESSHRDLQETISVVKAKMGEEVERAEEVFSPGKLLRDNLIGASCIAGLLGYLVGSSKYRKVVGPAGLAVVGYTIWSKLA